jgi:hypothetical protein
MMSEEDLKVDVIRCRECKHWDPNAKEVTEFFSIQLGTRRQNHPAGVGLCTHFYDRPLPPFPADEAFGWNLKNNLASDIFTGPEHGCVRGER